LALVSDVAAANFGGCRNAVALNLRGYNNGDIGYGAQPLAGGYRIADDHAHSHYRRR
jgi:hypothetical protein